MSIHGCVTSQKKRFVHMSTVDLLLHIPNRNLQRSSCSPHPNAEVVTLNFEPSFQTISTLNSNRLLSPSCLGVTEVTQTMFDFLPTSRHHAAEQRNVAATRMHASARAQAPQRRPPMRAAGKLRWALRTMGGRGECS